MLILTRRIGEALMNKQTQTASTDFSCSKKQISDDFYPNTKTIELALSMGLTKVTDFTEIQVFIKHTKHLNIICQRRGVAS